MEAWKGEHADIDDIIPIISVSFTINPEYPLLEPRIVISPFFCSPSPFFSSSVLAFNLWRSAHIACVVSVKQILVGDPIEVVSRCGKKYDDSNDATTG